MRAPVDCLAAIVGTGKNEDLGRSRALLLADRVQTESNGDEQIATAAAAGSVAPRRSLLQVARHEAQDVAARWRRRPSRVLDHDEAVKRAQEYPVA
jgi:hypothetical protein